MDKQLILQNMLEQSRREVLTNVVKQYTTEAQYNSTQYVKSVHAASVGFEAQVDKLRTELDAELEYTSNAVLNWLNSKYGKINLF